MELDITHLTDQDNVDLMDYSASIAEIGDKAGRETWNNALNTEHMLITKDQMEDVKDYIRDFGAWEDEEIDAWDLKETNALLLQFIAGDLREYLEAKESDDFDRWNENCGGRIYEDDKGTLYYYVGS
jgi:hypothetical protein